jgi:hypothetical protein
MDKKYYRLIIILTILLFFTCHYENLLLFEDSGNTPHFQDTLHINYKETIINTEENFSITFDSLLEDSRCPIGVECFWEGNAKIGFIFSSQKFELNTHPSFRNDSTLLRFNISLIMLNPYPHIDSTYSAEDYSADIYVQKVRK